MDVIGAAGTQYAKDITLVRNEDITFGTSIYNSNEWTAYPSNTFDDLGTHSALNSGGSHQTGTLFFSEYIEGSSYNKAIEIYNGTGQDINLSNVLIELSNMSISIALSGILQNGDVFVVSHSNADQSLLNAADMITSNLSFNGDDAITLIQNGEIIDVIGVAGTQYAKDTTLIRNENIVSGTLSYDINEWIAHPINTLNYIGFHD
ncbi:lamin tail domain-containing protein [Chengkuizengella sp. 2205SS18-9]|uniref:Lamin tail domain-containing protein n=1 Tax=Chengkuizengella axinellae TaxID=3064388 RepID=A0ABT9IUI1_9BACL|nr:lamin tail domain-containing protein [Chengkuizengella sp. 2205SS18-9]MDP5272991.1 lamin tail domain-containing protein [Chengkuizengella sp. 2205SS18-9]